ncbi:MAG: protein kinase [Myxococcales bacterium]|nr:protein kinase [Myxococcales bacterium]
MKGERIGSYRVERLIGQGGMGAVYEAVHEQLGRRAAIKLLRKELSQDAQIAMRFFREAQAANRVDHSGIVAIYEFGHLPDGTAYIIMEYLRGEALSARLRGRGGRLPYIDAVRISRQIASALAAAHSRNVIHRDLKPDNVMLVPDSEMPGGERVKILDFGVAKVDSEVVGPAAEDFKTDTGMVLGTASYMAPEQCKGAGNVTDRADVYALGVVLYRLLCGQLPFRAEGQGEVMAMHIFSTPKPLRDHDPNIPAPLVALVERMMAKDPNERPSMAQVAADLEKAASQIAPSATPVVVLSGSGPLTTGQTPTMPSAVPGPGDLRDRSSPQNSPISSTQAAEAAPRPRRSGFFWGALLVLGMGVGGLGTATHLGLVQLPLGVQQFLPDSLRQVLISQPPPPPPPKLVRWTISSEPAGAEVLDAATGTLLGTTPWFREQPVQVGKHRLRLHSAGYSDVTLDLDQTQDTSPHIRLMRSAVDDLGGRTDSPDGGPATPAHSGSSAGSPSDLGATASGAAVLKAGSGVTKPPAVVPRLVPPALPKKKPGGGTSSNLRDEEIPTALPEND